MLCECTSIILPTDERCEKCGKENPNVKTEDFECGLLQYHLEINGENRTVAEWLEERKSREQLIDIMKSLKGMLNKAEYDKVFKVRDIIQAVAIYAYRNGFISKAEFERDIKSLEKDAFEIDAEMMGLRPDSYRNRVQMLQEIVRGFLRFLAPTEEMVRRYQSEYRNAMGNNADIYRIDEELDLIKWVGYTPKQIQEKLSDSVVVGKIQTYVYWSALYEMLLGEFFDAYNEEESYIRMEPKKMEISCAYLDCIRKMIDIAKEKGFQLRNNGEDDIEVFEKNQIMCILGEVIQYNSRLSEQYDGFTQQGATELKDYVRNEYGKCKYMQLDRTERQLINSVLDEGCYIATAVYGDYNAYEVVALRRFRDEVLRKTIIGRLFIKCYYAVSPKMSISMKNKKGVNDFAKMILDRFVEILER